MNIEGINNAVDDSVLGIKEEMVSLTALNPMAPHNSAPRGTMFLGQFSQGVAIINPQPRILQTGLEAQLSDNTFKCVIEKDCTIKHIITTPDSYNIQDTEMIYLIVEDIEGKLDIINVPLYQAVIDFGFRYKRNIDLLSELYVGYNLKAGTVLADAPGNVNGIYSYGINADIMLITDPDTGQDGVIASQELMESMAYNMYYKIEANWDESKIPLNLYGDINNYKPFPEPGDVVNQDSIIFALRSLDENDVPSTIYDCMVPDPIYDECYYVDPTKVLKFTDGRQIINNKVISTKVYRSEVKKDNNLHGAEYIKYNIQKLKTFYNKIIKAYEGSVNKNITPTLQRLLVDAYAIANPNNDKIELRHRNDSFTTRVEIIVEYTVIPGIGSKVSDSHGAKGIVVDVRPRSEMGCDIIMDPTSLPGRMNPGRIIETYFMGSSRNAKEILKHHYHMHGLIPTFEKLLDYLKIFGTEQYYIYKDAYDKKELDLMEKAINTILEKELYIYYKISSKRKAIPIIRDLEKSEWKFPKRKVVLYGKETKKPINVYPVYAFLIAKTSDSFLSCASPYLNHYGLPVKPPSNVKVLKPWSNTPTKNIGETEFRVLVTNTEDPTFVAELADRATNIDSHTLVYKKMLEAEKPTDIDKCIDRTLHPYGYGASLTLFNDILKTMGIETKYLKEEKGPNEKIK